MEELKRDKVLIDLHEMTDFVAVLKVLTDAGEPIYEDVKKEFSRNFNDQWGYLYFYNDIWQRCNTRQGRTVISLDQLASMFGQYKYQIGDTVKCVENFSTDRIAGSGWRKGLEFIISKFNFDCCLPSYGHGVYPEWLQLVEKADKAIEKVAEVKVKKEKPDRKTIKISERTISREALGEIYEHVCQDWKDHIDSMLEAKDFKFADSIPVSEDFIKKAYEASSKTIHEEWLKKYLPPLKIKVEKEVTIYSILRPDGTFEGHFPNDYKACQYIKEMGMEKLFTAANVVKLSGTTVVEEDDPEYDFLPF